MHVDHTANDEIATLFEGVRREQTRLDVLAIVMTVNPLRGRTFLTTAQPRARPSSRLDLATHRDGVACDGAFYFDMMETLLASKTEHRS